MQKSCGAGKRLGLAWGVGTKHDPVYFQLGVSGQELEDRAAAADLDVIAVCTQTQDLLQFAKLETLHGASLLSRFRPHRRGARGQRHSYASANPRAKVPLS